jgi:hypothetical protein
MIFLYFYRTKDLYMKKVLLFIIAAMILTSCATYQKISLNSATRIYDVEGKNKQELYVKSMEWLIDSFNDVRSVVQFNDKGEGIIIGKYLMHSAKLVAVSLGGAGVVRDDVYAKIKINTKDGAARLIIEPLGEWRYSSDSLDTHSYSKNKAIDDINALIDSFEEMLGTPDEW